MNAGPTISKIRPVAGSSQRVNTRECLATVSLRLDEERWGRCPRPKPSDHSYPRNVLSQGNRRTSGGAFSHSTERLRRGLQILALDGKGSGVAERTYEASCQWDQGLCLASVPTTGWSGVGQTFTFRLPDERLLSSAKADQALSSGECQVADLYCRLTPSRAASNRSGCVLASFGEAFPTVH